MTSAELEADLMTYFARAAQDASCTRDVELARYVARELNGAEADAMAKHVESCRDCQALADDLAATAHAWKPEAGPLAPLLKFPRLVRIVAAPVLALAAALIAFVWTGRGPDDRLTPKGSAWSLELAVQRGGQQFRAPSGATLRTGDQLGLFYSAGSDGWLTVLYADDHGEPTRIFPAREQGSAKIAAGKNLPLRDGAVLGEGQGCEWVIGVFTKAPLSAARSAELVKQMVSSRHGCTLSSPPAEAHAETRVVVVKRGAAQ